MKSILFPSFLAVALCTCTSLAITEQEKKTNHSARKPAHQSIVVFLSRGYPCEV
jgi:hypothetical protein